MFKDIARLARISVPTVRYRIKRLLQRGLIRRFAALVDADKIVGRVRAIFSIRGRNTDLEEIAKKLSHITEIREIYLTSGTLGIVVKAEVSNSRELVELASKISSIPNITTTVLSIVTNTVKEDATIRIAPGAEFDLNSGNPGLRASQNL